MEVRLKAGSNRLVPLVPAADSVPNHGADLFAFITQTPGRRWVPAACSLALHTAMISGAFFFFDPPRQAVEGLASKYSLRLIRLRPSTARGPGSGGKAQWTGAGAASAGSSTDSGPGPGASANPEDRAAGLRPFELPRAPVQLHSAQTLLQPDFPASTPVTADVRLPELLTWKPQPKPAPNPGKRILAPHRSPDDPVQLNLPEPPALERPNREAQVKELATAGHGMNVSPLVPLPAGTAAPLRNRAPGASAPIPQIAPSISSDSSPVNVLSIPEIPVPPAGIFQLPAGNEAGSAGSPSNGERGQSGSAAGRGSQGSAIGAAGHHAGGGSGPDGGGSGPDGGGSVRDGRSPVADGAGSIADGRSPASATEAAGRETGRGSGSPGPEPGAGDSSLSGGKADSEAPGRKVTKVVLPANGRFSVLIESSGSEAFPEAEGILNGRHVYTVYVRTGARKEWILQYCLPEAVERTLPVSGRAAALEAPFPYLIMRPDLAYEPDVDYLIVHGIVTALGKFDQLGYVTAPDAAADKDLLLHSLEQWQFRPGKLDGQPTALEILLIIPRDRE